MQRITTAYFGQLEYTTASVWEFPLGIPGFEDEKAFVFVDQPSTRPLMFLQSLRTPDLCFIGLPVGVLAPDYRLQPTNDDLATLQLPAGITPEIGRDVICLALVTVDQQVGPTANLHSPLMINIQNRLGVQIIQPETTYSLRHPIAVEREVAACSC
jgi:flagellar assembly factor FliW